jgi:hypothetical protein
MTNGPTVSVATAAELTGLSKKAIRRRIERGTLKSTLLEGHHHIALTELQRSGLLNERPPAGEGGEAAGPFPPGAAHASQLASGGEGPAERRSGPRAEAGETPAVLERFDSRSRFGRRPAGSDDQRAALIPIAERLAAVEQRLTQQAEANARVESELADVRRRLTDLQTQQRSLGSHLHQMQAWFRQLSAQRRSRFLRRHHG